jgi:hypothetical protein
MISFFVDFIFLGDVRDSVDLACYETGSDAGDGSCITLAREAVFPFFHWLNDVFVGSNEK